MEDEDGGGGGSVGSVAQAPVQELLLIEVNNATKVIIQAEAPHPRRWPRRDAWAWLQEWATREGLSPEGYEGITAGRTAGWDRSGDAWSIERHFLA
mmetsp:Transcript_105709/g.275169  ORF Transcript_105709/g.275169 Transcript_105709/m.275169 type:complete len:96 (-) Transcript_105709:67-354(-)